MVIATKYCDDHSSDNTNYAYAGGVHVSELNHMEVEFLFTVNFDLFITHTLFQAHYDDLII